MSQVHESHAANIEYSIRDAAVKLGVPVQKLRRWDAQGVLVARRTEGGHRRYPREMIEGLARAPLGVAPEYEDKLASAKKTLREKRRIIQLLLESENRYRDLVETSHDLIWTTDAQGHFTYLNNATMDIFGLTPKELIGRSIFDFETRPSQISNRRFLSALRRHGQVKDYVTKIISSDGTDRWVGILHSPNSRLYQITLSPDGRTLAGVGSGDGQVYIYDVSSLALPAAAEASAPP